MSDDVTIPRDVAREWAQWIREDKIVTPPNGWSTTDLADLLDPKPPTLREKVAEILAAQLRHVVSREADADAVLAVIAKDLRAFQVTPSIDSADCRRGASDATIQYLARLKGGTS